MLGLALEGGGAKGAFQMGAVKAFLEEGYQFSGIAGTSIGALNGAIIAQGDFELGYQWWENMDTSMLFDIKKAHVERCTNKKVDIAALRFWASILKNIIGNRGLDTQKIRETLQSVINEEKLRQSKTDLGIVTVSISDWKPLELFKEDIPEGLLIDYLMASANFPVFRIEPIEGRYYIDGGFYDSCPVNLLSRKGYRDIIAIRTFGFGRIRKVEDDQVNVTSVCPSENLGRILLFDNNVIRKNLNIGYCDAMRIIKRLKGTKYYIQGVHNENAFMKCLLSIPDRTICDIGTTMGFSGMEPKRMLFERILPALSQMLGLPPKSTYQDIIIGVLEHMAENAKIERHEVRSMTGFIWEIKKARHHKNIPDDSSPQSNNTSEKPSEKRPKRRAIEKAGEAFLKVLTL
jgi:NTE family protein